MTVAVHEHARAVRADLARGIEVGEQSAGHGVVEFGVLEHDQRRLAAELERHVLERARGVVHHRLAGADLAGERHLADIGMARQQTAGSGSGPARPGRRRPAGRPRDRPSASFGAVSGVRLGRLEDHRVAAGERGRRLPAGDLQRIVPGTDAGDNAERLAARVAEGRRAQIDVLAGCALRERRRNTRGTRRPKSTSTTRVSWIGLPVSRVSSSASASFRARSNSAARRRIRARSAPASAAQAGCASRAAATAASISRGPATGTSPSRSPVAGLKEARREFSGSARLVKVATNSLSAKS